MLMDGLLKCLQGDVLTFGQSSLAFCNYPESDGYQSGFYESEQGCAPWFYF